MTYAPSRAKAGLNPPLQKGEGSECPHLLKCYVELPEMPVMSIDCCQLSVEVNEKTKDAKLHGLTYGKRHE